MSNIPDTRAGAPGRRSLRAWVGEVRASQALSPYGVGNVIDLPQLSVLVMGLDDWPQPEGPETIITEPRLLRAVQSEAPEVTDLRRVPLSERSELGLTNPLDSGTRTGVPVRLFPRWLVCPACRTLADVRSGLFQFEDGRNRPDRARFVHANCQKARKPPAAMPARFMVACENGHLDDFPWITFIHRGQTCSKSAILKLIEYGPSGEARDLVARCEACGAERRMAEAFTRENMPPCRGAWPHLRAQSAPDQAGCQCANHEHARTILLGASNLWFPVLYSAIALPDTADPLEQLVREQWAGLRAVKHLSELEFLRRRGELGAFAAYELADVLTRIERIRSLEQNRSAAGSRPAGGEREDDSDRPQGHESLKAPEWAIFSNPGASASGEDFLLREVDVPARFRGALARVTLVERLREVRALAGFTRIDAPGEIADLDTEIVGSRLAPLSRGATKWLPAAELRGEGIFIQFDERAVQEWQSRPECEAWEREFRSAHRQWRQARYLPDLDHGFPGLRYVLLHTFSHALMRQFALECGYSPASLQERVYSAEPDQAGGPMAGVLIYTSATDSEGTLGGLVRLGETPELARHLERMLQGALLCSSDPTCAEHMPTQSALSVHGAACHACLFAPETSCERGNKYLDRSVLVETLTTPGRAIF